VNSLTGREKTVKTEIQQPQRLVWHSLRVGWVDERTALLNRVRWLLTEFGLIVDPGPKHRRALLAEQDFDTAIPLGLRDCSARSTRCAGRPERKMRPADRYPEEQRSAGEACAGSTQRRAHHGRCGHHRRRRRIDVPEWAPVRGVARPHTQPCRQQRRNQTRLDGNIEFISSL
jgi:hypothetical protein